MKKKVFAALLSATMVMSMMTACGNEPTQQPLEESTQESSTQESSAAPGSEESSVESSVESSAETPEEPAGGLAEAEPCLTRCTTLLWTEQMKGF